MVWVMASNVPHKTSGVEDACWIEASLDFAHQGKGSPIRTPHIYAASQTARNLKRNHAAAGLAYARAQSFNERN
jgi:hypothetical protein